MPKKNNYKNENIKVGEFRGRVLTCLDYMEGDIKEIKRLHNNEIKELKRGIKKNGDSIIGLEKKWAKATGIASGIGAAAGFIANIIFG